MGRDLPLVTSEPRCPDLDLPTIPDLVGAAKSVLEPPVWQYLIGGAGTEWTVRQNRAALERLVFRPRVLVDVGDRRTESSLLECNLRIPVFLAPMGSVGRFCADGALAVARVAERTGTLCFVSENAGSDPGDICAKTDAKVVWQTYGYDDIERTKRLVRRVEDAGCVAVCVTANSPAPPWRDREVSHGFRSVDAKERMWMDNSRAAFTWDRLQQIRSWTDLPLVLKGVLRPEDAARATDLGVDVIYVSNLGGRALDFAPATVDVLPDIVAAVDDHAAVIVDGGFQRGTDVLKGVALGATAVGIGRLQAYALAAAGEAGLEHALSLIEKELLASMAMLGVPDIRRIEPDIVRLAH